MQLNELLSSDIAVVAVIAVAVLFIVIIVLVANRISAIDNKISLLTEDLDKHVGKSLLSLSDNLHDDLDVRNKRIETSLEHMGDSWRDSLNKTVTHLRSEIDQFESGIAEKTQQQYSLLEEKLTGHATDVSEQLAVVRDTHHQEIQNYHQQLATQVKEHAISEKKTLTSSLNLISDSVKQNLGDLVSHQLETLENVAETVCKTHDELKSQASSDIVSMTSKTSTDLDNLITRTDTSSSKLTNRLNKELSGLVSKVDNNVTGLNNKINSDLASLTGSITSKLTHLTGTISSNLSSLTSQVISRVSTCTGQLDEDLSNISGRVDQRLTDLNAKMDNQLSNLSGKMDQGITTIAKQVSDDFDSATKKLNEDMTSLESNVSERFVNIEDNIDKRIRKEMSELQSIFAGFAGKVSAIEETREKITSLAENIDILSKVLDDRRSRGALGGLVLKSIIEDNLKPNDYVFNARLSNGTDVACLLKLPQPSGDIAISTKIDISDLEKIFTPVSSNAEIESARNKFRQKLRSAIEETADNYIIPGETAEGAVLLLPSENAFSEVHVRHRDLVNEAYKQRVWLTSPSTLIVMVTVARAVIKDATARQEMELVHGELLSIENDYGKLASNIVSITGKIDELLETATSTRKEARLLDERFVSLIGMFKSTQQESLQARDNDKLPTKH